MTEDAFLDRLMAGLPAAPAAVVIPPGDDCAALDLGNGRWQLLAVDQVVGNRHYRQQGPDATPPELAGRKLLARNLSDIAAMGGVPTYCLVAGAFGPDCDETWIERFFAGVTALARQYQVAMIGGDLARAPGDTVVSLTIAGEVPAAQAVRRSGARPGDELWATGAFGDSFPTGHHLTFEPRCAEGRWLAEHGFARAMMDVSDGLRLDAARLCQASGVSVRLNLAAVPRRTPTTTRLGVLGDGEDYELILAVAPGRAAALSRRWPFATALTHIGGFAAGPAAVYDLEGHLLDTAGFDHFAPRGEDGR